ncbi:MAG TPA: outer membrane beta-barrel protein [Edaphocola sp.]|nr:outer membrane beta-barrel protein [Edaphocola sp.]
MTQITYTVRLLSLGACMAYLLQPTELWAQQAVLLGSIRDTVLQEPALMNIGLVAKDALNSQTDEHGAFLFAAMPPGPYTLLLSGEGYPEQRIKVFLNANDTTRLDLKVGIQLNDATGAVVVASRPRHTTASILQDMKSGTAILSGIAAEQIKHSQDNNAAQVMSRIPGVTVVGGSFVMVRGVPERYNQVLLNKAIAPSSEVDRRTFSFDLIPSNLLERMMVYKSGNAEQVGDFAGGLTQVYTAMGSSSDYTQVNFSTGFRLGTTFEPYYQSQGSATDFLGFDNGLRSLPASFPKFNLRSLPNRSPERIAAAHLLPNNFSMTKGIALPDIGSGLTLSRNMKWGEKRIQTLSSINYSQSFNSYRKRFNRFLEQDPVSGAVEPRFSYLDQNYEKDNRITLMSNWSLWLNPRNRISLRNLFNQIGENSTILREGQDFIQFSGYQRRNYQYQYRSRSIYTAQLTGDHDLSRNREQAQLDWLLAFHYMAEQLPDLRRFRTIATEPGSNQYRMILPPSSNLYDAGRFYSNLAEIGIQQGVNLNLNLSTEGFTKTAAQLKTGYLVDARTRNFATRYFSYFYPGNASLEQQQRLERLPLEQIFSHENIKTDNGFSLEEGTRISDNYSATNVLSAAYAAITLPFYRFNVNTGIRLEYNVLRLDAQSETGMPLRIHRPVLSPLLYFTGTYLQSERNQLRWAYSRSVNRPEFRELAPFLFYDYQFDAERYGNPDLKTAIIDNLDLRYEFYPRSGELLSLGAFYKHFRNPIESLILIRSESPAFSFQNAERAMVSGLELEWRKSFNGMGWGTIMDKMSINLNASYMLSEVDYGKNASKGQEQHRALQGQSPYVVNAMMQYAHTKRSFNATLAYNLFGPRIFSVSSTLFPSIYEMPRHALDFSLSKAFGQQWTIKLGIQDILQAPYRFYQDTDRNGSIDLKGGSDLEIFRHRKGALINMSINYKF